MARDACMPGVRERSGCAHQNNHRAMESVALSGLPPVLERIIRLLESTGTLPATPTTKHGASLH